MKIIIFGIFVLTFSFENEAKVLSSASVAPREFRRSKVDNGTDSGYGIFGGNRAQVGQFPWMAALTVESNVLQNGNPTGEITHFGCGASLISAQHLVTAAHCIRLYRSDTGKESLAAKVFVKLGSVDNNLDGTEIVTQRYQMHPSWNPFDVNVKNDIAIIYLPTPVQFTQSIYPVSLPTGKEDFAGQYAVASGFGLTPMGDTPYLNYVQMQVMSNQECRTRMPQVEYSQVCTSPYDSSGSPTLGVCSGDSGGPLVVRDSANKAVLIGVTSYVIDCGRDVSVFTRITSFMEFIKSYVPNV